jgi:hypothetical protein
MNNAIRVFMFGAGSTLALSVSAANLIENSDFNTNLDGWTPSSDGTVAIDTTTGFPAAPSIHLTAGGASASASATSDCIALDDSDHVDLYANIKGVSGAAEMSINTFSDAACTTALDKIDTGLLASNGRWQTYSLTDIALVDGTQSVTISLSAQGTVSTMAEALFDHVAFGPTGTAQTFIDINQEGLTGTWYNPQTSGQGLQFQIAPDDQSSGDGALFGALFTFDTVAGGADSQRWYSIQGGVSEGATDSAVTIYQNTGGVFDAGPATSPVAVGTGALMFDTCQSGTFNYTFNDGRNGSIPIQRLFPNVECVDSATPTNPVSDFGFSGTWYNAATSGQGMMIEVNPSNAQAFVGWYTYAQASTPSGLTDDASGQRWFSAQSSYTVGTRSIDLTLYNSIGGAFDASDPVTTDPVGTATLTYTSCTDATFDYTFTAGEMMGRTGSVPLTRLFDPLMSCSFNILTN